MVQCEKCMTEKPCEWVDVWHPNLQKEVRHHICSSCKNKIVAAWFDTTKTGSW